MSLLSSHTLYYLLSESYTKFIYFIFVNLFSSSYVLGLMLLSSKILNFFWVFYLKLKSSKFIVTFFCVCLSSSNGSILSPLL